MPYPLNPHRVLVVMPAWNEEAAVGDTVREVRASAPDLTVLVVDDGSTDRTRQQAMSAGAAVLSLPFNLGVGGAMRAGFRYALRNGYDVVVQVDADGQHNPTDIARLLERLQTANVVVGARFAEESTYVVKGPRRWAMAVLARTMSRIAGTHLTDVTSGFRAADRDAIALFAQHYPAEYLGDTVESLVIAVRAGCRVTQVGVNMRARRGGAPSHRPVKATVYLFRACFALLLALVRRWPAELHQVREVEAARS